MLSWNKAKHRDLLRIPTLRRDISLIIRVLVGKPRSLSVSTQKVVEAD